MKQLRKVEGVIVKWLLCMAIALIAMNLSSFTMQAHANDKDVLLFSGTGELTRDEVQTQAYKDENISKKIAKIEGYSSIGEGAFGGQKFEIVIIGDSVNDIYEEAFASIINCKYIVLPNSLRSIQGTTAFCGARCIVYSGYLDDPNNWGAPIRCDKIVDGFCLSSDGMLLSGYVGDSRSITIPSGVDSIDDGAFAKSYLQEIVIPAYVQILGDGLFEECWSLDCVKFEDISNLGLNVNPFMDTPNNVCFDIEKADDVSKIKSLYDLILSDTSCRVRVHPMYYDEVSKTCNVEKLPLPEPLPEKLFKYDADSNMFVLTVNDENRDVIAAYKDIRILANHKLIIDTDLVITGDLIVDSFGAITINKGCSISAFYVDLSNIVSVTLGDKDCLAGLEIDAEDVKLKHTGDPVFYEFDPKDIDNTEFMKENGLLVYKDGPDCGINMNSDGTCVSEDGETKYGDVYYEVYTNPDDDEPAYTGILEEDWASVDMDPAKFKAGSRIDFIVKAYNGKVLQTNGVRFPDNKTYISTREEEVKADIDEGCKCSYVLPEDPDRYLSVTVHFVDPDELLTDATFAWSYDERVQQYVFDNYVSHGEIEVVSAYNEGEPLFNSHKPDTSPYWSEPGENVTVSDEKGHKWFEKQGRFPIGTELIVRLIPDRGYQLTKFTISNIESSTTAVDGVNEYTFNLARPDYYHLCAVFTPVEDKVDILTSSGITAGSVTFDDTEVDNGTMVLNVSDATPDAEEKSAFETMADNKGYEVAKCLNLESEQRFYKGVENATREQCWIVEKSELDSPADITLEVSGLESEDVIVLHNHNGVYEEIPATYKNGQLSFSAQSFSDFAIATKKKKEVTPGGQENPGVKEDPVIKEDPVADEDPAEKKVKGVEQNVLADDGKVYEYVVTLTKGGKATIPELAKERADGKSFKIEYTDKKIAVMSSKGVINGKKDGCSILTITKGNEKHVIYVTVTSPKYANKTIYVNKGESIDSAFTGTKLLTVFTSKKESIAIVDEKGFVTGVNKGKTTVIATTEDGKKYKCNVQVCDQVITGKDTVKVGKSTKLKVKYGVKDTTWTSSDPSIATVDAKGKVTGVSAGDVVITAVNNGKTITKTISIK